MAGKAYGKELVKAEAAVILKDRLKGAAARKLGKIGANRSAFWLAARNSYRKVLAVVGSVLRDHPKFVTIELRMVDISAPVRFEFRHAGLGRESFRRLTDL